MYSRNDVKQAIAEGHLKIIPYEEKNLTGRRKSQVEQSMDSLLYV